MSLAMGTVVMDGYTVGIQRVSLQFKSYYSCRAKGYTSLIFVEKYGRS